MSNWTTYGKWREKPYPQIAWTMIRKRLFEKYGLPDLGIVSYEQTAYEGINRVSCIYPWVKEKVKS
jgi:hypothetical protein